MGESKVWAYEREKIKLKAKKRNVVFMSLNFRIKHLKIGKKHIIEKFDALAGFYN